MTTYEIEIVGGASGYLRNFSQRKFRSLAAAGRYACRVRAVTDENGTTACHQIIVWHDGTDVTRDAFDAVDREVA